MNLNGQFKAERLSAFDGFTVTDRMYNMIIGLVVLWGIAVNYIMCRFLVGPILSMNYLAVLVLYFAGSIGGMFVVYKSPSAVVSFLGFTVMAVAMGLLLTFFVSMYSDEVIRMAVRVTATTTCVMLILALIYPGFFLGLWRTLFVSLLVCVVVQGLFSFLFRVRLEWMDWLVALIFCGYIGYDWAKAQVYPKTIDNAVDSAADIYVDIVNLFIRILQIVARSRSSKD